MHYADHVGLKTVVERLKAYQAQMGDFFKVSPLLEKLAAEGGKLSSVSNWSVGNARRLHRRRADAHVDVGTATRAADHDRPLPTPLAFPRGPWR